VAAQKTACQLSNWAITPASGMPIAAPTPRVELIMAVPAIIRSAGSSSLRMLMPSGSTPNAAPCNIRATSSSAKDPLTAPTIEPAVISPSATARTSRLPTMSPSRPAIGAHTAPVSIVTVSSQDAASWESPRWREMSGSNGTTRVCISDTVTPQPHNTTMSRRERTVPAREPMFTPWSKQLFTPKGQSARPAPASASSGVSSRCGDRSATLTASSRS